MSATLTITLLDGTAFEVHPSSFNAALPPQDAVHAIWRRIESSSIVPLQPLLVRKAEGPWNAAHFSPMAVAGIFFEDSGVAELAEAA